MNSVCTVNVWYEGQRVAQLVVNPATRLRELLVHLAEHNDSIPLPVVEEGEWSEASTFPYDGSVCGEATLLLVEQGDTTLQALGWFPSGVLELRHVTPEEPGRRYDGPPPSSFFDAVRRRHDDALALDAGLGNHRIATTASATEATRKRDAAAAKVDAARRRAESAKNERAATKLWQMLAKQVAVGPNLRDADRFYLVVDRGDAPALYYFVPRSASAGRALADAAARLSLEDVVLVECATETTIDLTEPIAAQLAPFAILRLVPRAAAAVPRPIQPSVAGEVAAPDPCAREEERATSDEGVLPLIVKFASTTHHLGGLRPDSTVADLRAAIRDATGVDPARQNLVCKAASLLNDPTRRLSYTQLQPNSRIILMRQMPSKHR